METNLALRSGRLALSHRTAIPQLLHAGSFSYYQKPNSLLQQTRWAHSRRHASSAALSAVQESQPILTPELCNSAPLSCLPWSNLIRSYLITSISSIPILLRPSLSVLAFLAKSKSRFLNPDLNPILKAILKRTFYAQFCAGENAKEVHQTMDILKQMGYKGVILGHAKEAVLTKSEIVSLNTIGPDQAATNAKEIAEWKENTLNTIALSQKDDFVAIKFTGAGLQALQHLQATIPCAAEFEKAVHEICQLAQKRGVSMLFDAEQAALQAGIDNWTMYFMKHYNKGEKAVVYGTYQAYAKRTPEVLARHLELARAENFVLGVKLVRGAYLGSDPRELFWDTIEDTHKCYDNLTQCVIQQKYGGLLQPCEGSSGEFPKVNLVLASHNAASVRRARKLRDEQAAKGEARIQMAYGQLMGMADNVSCELVQEAKDRNGFANIGVDVPRAYKYLVWGSLGDCMKYLLRRAQENKDAVSRTIEAREALGKELARRMKMI